MEVFFGWWLQWLVVGVLSLEGMACFFTAGGHTWGLCVDDFRSFRGVEISLRRRKALICKELRKWGTVAVAGNWSWRPERLPLEWGTENRRH